MCSLGQAGFVCCVFQIGFGGEVFLSPEHPSQVFILYSPTPKTLAARALSQSQSASSL
jgi:hypothetical protein